VNCVWVLEQGVGAYKYGYYEVAIPATSLSTTATDLAWLRRQKLLTPGTSSPVNWTTGGRPSGSIQNEVRTDTVRLVYRTQRTKQ
jgi:hypothetical protein